MPNDNDKTLLGTLLTWFIVAVIALAAIKVALWALGMAIGLGMFAVAVAIRLLPILLVGWLVIKLFRAFGRRSDDDYETV